MFALALECDAVERECCIRASKEGYAITQGVQANALTFAEISAYIAQTFGLRTLGRVTGCVFTFGAVVNLLQAPIVNFMNFELGGDTDLIALGMLAVGLGMFVPVCASGHLAPAAV